MNMWVLRLSLRRGRALAAVVAALAVVTLAPAAATASGKLALPASFWGANWDWNLGRSSSKHTVDAAWSRMAKSGVRAQRMSFFWAVAQPTKNGPIDFKGTTDRLVRLGARNGIRIMPTVELTPAWARAGDAHNAPPTKSGRKAYANYLRAAIARYGPKGTFWKDNPKLPKMPIRDWQVLNEPSVPQSFTPPPGQDWALAYSKVLKPSYQAIKKADPGARVILAGLTNRSWIDLDHLYKVGHIRGYFDVAAVHPYTSVKHGELTLIRYFRNTLTSHGDGKLPIVVTEAGAPASRGRVPHDDDPPFQTDDAGMADVVRELYGDLAKDKNWKKLRVRCVYFYKWASTYQGGWYFDYSGLMSYQRQNGHDVVKAKPALAVYRKLATGAS